jgi:hypothetical protein
MLSNVYLHYVLDEWFERQIKPRLQGAAYLIRYGDDFVLGFAQEEDARRVQAVLPKRFGQYGLTLHPEKTRLIPFQRPPSGATGKRGGPGHAVRSFDLLGFTHYWGRSRKGHWVIKRKTASDRRSRALRTIAQWCRRHRHRPLEEQHRTLSQKLRGHGAYYGLIGNSAALSGFRREVSRIWRKWLSRQADAVGSLRPVVGTVSAPRSPRLARHATKRSETIIRGTVCVNRARTALWGLRVGNYPGLPGGQMPPLVLYESLSQ